MTHTHTHTLTYATRSTYLKQNSNPSIPVGLLVRIPLGYGTLTLMFVFCTYSHLRQADHPYMESYRLRVSHCI